jgi:hypothetical protein
MDLLLFLSIVWVAIKGKLFALVILILLDFILGTTLAIVQKRFELARLADYLSTDFMPLLGWLAVEILLKIPIEFIPTSAANIINQIGTVVYATVFLAILGSVLGHLAAIGVLKSTLGRVGVKPTGGEVFTAEYDERLDQVVG